MLIEALKELVAARQAGSMAMSAARIRIEGLLPQYGDEFMTSADASQVLGIQPQTVRKRAIKRGTPGTIRLVEDRASLTFPVRVIWAMFLEQEARAKKPDPIKLPRGMVTVLARELGKDIGQISKALKAGAPWIVKHLNGRSDSNV